MECSNMEGEGLWELFEDFKHEDKRDDVICFCKYPNFVVKDGYTVCSNCSVIIDKELDTKAEWRYFEGKPESSRCGMPISDYFPKSCMGTIIGKTHGCGKMGYLVNRNHIWNNKEYTENSLKQTFDFITEKGTAGGLLPCIIEDAKRLYDAVITEKIKNARNDLLKKDKDRKNFDKYGVSKGDKRKGIIGACVFMACKMNGVARNVKEISSILDIDKKFITRGCKEYQSIIFMPLGNVKSSDFIARYISNVIERGNTDIAVFEKDMNDKIEKCIDIIDKLEKQELLTAFTPPIIAGSCIWFCIINYKWTNIKYDSITQNCDINTLSLKKCTYEMLKIKDKLL